MCGIFGYIGNRNAADIVATGLKRLEYRGYDSWGIAVRNEKGEMRVEKKVGAIGDVKSISHLSPLASPIGIGHTRWATHGGVTEQNAHPHLDCKKEIAVVHNGIIENFEDIKKELKRKGHKFISDTDSEAIPHLLEELVKKESFENAFKAAFKKIEGMNAVVATRAKENKILAAKSGSPLVIGKGYNEYFIASDPSGILEHTKKLFFLDDKQLVALGDQETLINLKNNKKIKIKFETADWETKIETKGKFPHFMIKEISDQPKIIRTIAKQKDSNIERLAKEIANAKGTFFIGAGTAYHAGLVGIYLFSEIAKKHVNTAVASEFNYLLDFINEKSLVVALSQSGETVDVIEPLSVVKNKKSTIASLVNSPGSSIFRMSDIKILLNAGIEQAVASTKAYTAKLAILILISYILKGDSDRGINLLVKASSEIERLIKNRDKLEKIADVLIKSENIYLIGRGVSYPTALEAALKIKEVSYIHAEGLAGGELKHGTIALISKGTPCIVFAPQDATYNAIISNAIEIKSRGGVIIGVGAKKEPVFDYFIEVKNCFDANALVQIIPAQILAYYLAVKKGYNPDKPRNLAKSVTVK